MENSKTNNCENISIMHQIIERLRDDSDSISDLLLMDIGNLCMKQIEDENKWKLCKLKIYILRNNISFSNSQINIIPKSEILDEICIVSGNKLEIIKNKLKQGLFKISRNNESSDITSYIKNYNNIQKKYSTQITTIPVGNYRDCCDESDNQYKIDITTRKSYLKNIEEL